ncbi:hypothetical protein QTO34_012285 [Cnephaeus nilssonii]|uniref:Ribonuclease P/MRP protein subunit POP5 n=1 Tax=Cnephaeus nilssonii TaxID=3371016 RepID=A0AA40LDH9_CNENI|nr:hypothetical protein QTO34_012285 [Eptesicus nilssonii]
MVRFKHALASAHLPLVRPRYLLCEVVSDDPRCRLSLDDRVLGGLVRDTIARLHGTFGGAACSIGFAGTKLLALRRLSYPKTFDLLLRIVSQNFSACCSAIPQCLYWNSATSMPKGVLPACVVTLPFITHLENKGHRYPCFLNTLHVGGTIRTCQKFLIQYNRRQLLILLQNCTDEGEREAIQKSVTRSCLLEEEPGEEELSDGGEEAAEAME